MNTVTQPSSFLVYKASAGSGKTFNLAKTYLSICFRHFAQDKYVYRKILGITFTNKAVSEMKTRILYFLNVLSKGEDEELMVHFTGTHNPTEIAAYAAELLKLIHHDYSNFSILTIDSLFERIIRTFSVDLKLPLNHTLSLDADLLMKQAVDILLSKLGHDNDLDHTIIHYAYRRMDSNKNWKIDNDLLQKGKEIYKENSMEALACLRKYTLHDFSQIRKELDQIINNMDAAMKQKAQIAVDYIQMHDVSLDDFYQAKKGIGYWFQKIARTGMSVVTKNKFVEDSVYENKWTSKATEPVIKQNIETLAPRLIEYYQDIQQYYQNHNTKYQICNAIKNSIYAISLLHQLKEILDTIKQEDQSMYISESNQYIAKIVQQEAIPYIYERLGERYKYFFIDEFQDTSILQWQNLLPLITEALSAETFTGQTGLAAVFGDVKQAVYRFRGGDVRQFHVLPAITGSDKRLLLKERENKLKEHFQEINLSMNYRSKKEIVEFNNNYFEYIRKDREAKDSYVFDMYKDVKQSFKAEHSGGGVCLYAIKKEQLGDFTYQEYLTQVCEQIIKQVLSDGYALSDIAILTRKNDLGAYITKILSENGIAVISFDSLLLVYDEDVAFLTACLSTVYTPENTLARVNMLHYISKQKKLSLEHYVQAVHNEHDFTATLSKLGFSFQAADFTHLNAYELVEHIIRIFNLDAKNNPFVMAFVGVVLQYQMNMSKQYMHFLEYWEEHGDDFSLSNPEGMNAVNVMSIHKAKGLEFPVVIYPQHNTQSHNDAYAWIYVNKDEYPMDVAYVKLSRSLENTAYESLYKEEIKLQELDNINVEYVAFTRAKERLYLISQDDEKSPLTSYFRIHNQLYKTGTYGDVIYKQGLFERCEKSKKNPEEVHLVSTLAQDIIASPELVSDIVADSDEIRWGNALHTYVAMLKTEKDVDGVKNQIQLNPALRDAEKIILQRVVDNLCQPDTKGIFFGSEAAIVKTEVELLDAEAQSFRIDRLVTDGERSVVLDFKTGNKEISHSRQLNHYVDLLKQTGCQQVEAFLVYIHTDGACSFDKI